MSATEFPELTDLYESKIAQGKRRIACLESEIEQLKGQVIRFEAWWNLHGLPHYIKTNGSPLAPIEAVLPVIEKG